MFYRLERTIYPCAGLGYTAYTKHLAKLGGDNNWDQKVGLPLQDLECKVAWRLFYEKKLGAPVTWRHPRPHHFRDPYLREVSIQYAKRNEHEFLFFGCQTLEQLEVWFPKNIMNIMIEEFGFGIKKYHAKLVWHGLRQSMLDIRSVDRTVYSV